MTHRLVRKGSEKVGSPPTVSARALIGPGLPSGDQYGTRPHFSNASPGRVRSGLGATTATSCDGATLYRGVRAGGWSRPKWFTSSAESAARIMRPHMGRSGVGGGG